MLTFDGPRKKGLICTCGEKHIIREELTIWDDRRIKCSCGKLYLAFMNGHNRPQVWENKEWIPYKGITI